MNDTDLANALTRIHTEAAGVPSTPALRDRLMRIAVEHPERPRRGPRLLRWRPRPILRAAEIAAAAGVVAVLGGFLLVGALTTRQGDESAPGVGASPSVTAMPDASEADAPSADPGPVVTDRIELWPGEWEASAPGCCEDAMVSIVAAGDAVWVASTVRSGVVSRIDTSTREVTDTFWLDSEPRWLLPHRDALWIIADGSLARISLADRDIERFERLGDVRHLPIVQDDSMWVNASSGAWVQMDLADPQDRISYASAEGLGPATWAADVDGALWSLHPEGTPPAGSPTLARFDPGTGEFTDTYQLERGEYGLDWGQFPMGDCCVATDDAIWIMRDVDQREVARFDVSTREFTDSYPGSRLGMGLVADGALWVPSDPAGDGDELLRIDPQTRELTDRIAVGNTLARPAFGDGAIWTEHLGTLSRIDPETRTVTAEISVGSAEDGLQLVVTEGAIWVPSAGYVKRVDTGAGNEDGPGTDPATAAKEDEMKLKTPIATALAVGLLASPGAIVNAQAEPIEPPLPVEVTGTFTTVVGTCRDVDETIGTVERNTDTCHPSWTMSDERLEGDLTWVTSEQGWTLDDGTEIGTGGGALAVENAGGTWQERPLLEFGYTGRIEATEADVVTRVFDGQGDYDGLVAIIDFRFEEDGVTNLPVQLYGYIIEGEYPPAPVIAPTG